MNNGNHHNSGKIQTLSCMDSSIASVRIYARICPLAGINNHINAGDTSPNNNESAVKSNKKNPSPLQKLKPVSTEVNSLVKLDNEINGHVVTIRKFENGSSVTRNKTLEFNKVFPMNQNNVDIYNGIKMNDIVKKVLDGNNATIVAYGVTGSGKSVTMGLCPKINKSQEGIIALAIKDLFNQMKGTNDSQTNNFYFVEMSYVELYRNNLRNLLKDFDVNNLNDNDDISHTNSNVSESFNTPNVKGKTKKISSNGNIKSSLTEKIEIHESNTFGVFLTGNSNIRIEIKSAEEAIQLLQHANKQRMIRDMEHNKFASRSHALCTIHIESRTFSSSQSELVLSKLQFVDFAGADSLGSLKATDEHDIAAESQSINTSLTALGDILLALSSSNQRTHKTSATKSLSSEISNTDSSLELKPTLSNNSLVSVGNSKATNYVPYKNSKITHLLKDSLGHNTHTIFLVHLRNEPSFYQQSVTVLNYAAMAMKLPADRLTVTRFNLNGVRASRSLHDIGGGDSVEVDDQLSDCSVSVSNSSSSRGFKRWMREDDPEAEKFRKLVNQRSRDAMAQADLLQLTQKNSTPAEDIASSIFNNSEPITDSSMFSHADIITDDLEIPSRNASLHFDAINAVGDDKTSELLLKINELEQMNLHLKKAYSTLEDKSSRELLALQQKNNQVSENVLKLNEEIDALRGLIKSSDDRNREIESQSKELNEQLNVVQSENVKYSNEIDSLKQTIESFHALHKDNETEWLIEKSFLNTTMDTLLDTEHEKERQMGKEVETLSNEMGEWKMKLEEKTMELEGLRVEKMTYDENCKAWLKMMTDLTATITSEDVSMISFTTLYEAISYLKERVLLHQHQNETMKKDYEFQLLDMMKQIMDLKEGESKRQQEMKSIGKDATMDPLTAPRSLPSEEEASDFHWKEENESLKFQIELLQKQLDELKVKELKSLENKIEMDQLQRDYAIEMEKLGNREKELKLMKEEKASWEVQMATWTEDKKEIHQLTAKIIELEVQLVEWNRKWDEKKKDEDKLKKEYNEMSGMMVDYEEKLKSLKILHGKVNALMEDFRLKWDEETKEKMKWKTNYEDSQLKFNELSQQKEEQLNDIQAEVIHLKQSLVMTEETLSNGMTRENVLQVEITGVKEKLEETSSECETQRIEILELRKRNEMLEKEVALANERVNTLTLNQSPSDASPIKIMMQSNNESLLNQSDSFLSDKLTSPGGLYSQYRAMISELTKDNEKLLKQLSVVVDDSKRLMNEKQLKIDELQNQIQKLQIHQKLDVIIPSDHPTPSDHIPHERDIVSNIHDMINEERQIISEFEGKMVSVMFELKLNDDPSTQRMDKHTLLYNLYDYYKELIMKTIEKNNANYEKFIKIIQDYSSLNSIKPSEVEVKMNEKSMDEDVLNRLTVLKSRSNSYDENMEGRLLLVDKKTPSKMTAVIQSSCQDTLLMSKHNSLMEFNKELQNNLKGKDQECQQLLEELIEAKMKLAQCVHTMQSMKLEIFQQKSLWRSIVKNKKSKGLNSKK